MCMCRARDEIWAGEVSRTEPVREIEAALKGKRGMGELVVVGY